MALLAALLCSLAAAAQDLGDDSVMRPALSSSAFADGMKMRQTGVSPSFDFNPSSGDGPAALSSALTVNGTAMTLLVDCDARTISGASWPCATGGTLAETGASGTVTSGKRTPVFSTDTTARAVSYTPGGNKGHQSASGTLADYTTGDFAGEAVFAGQAATDGYITGTWNGTTGWLLYRSAGAEQVRLAIGDTDSSSECAVATSASAWNHVIWFIDRSYASSQLCVNGTCAACNQSGQNLTIASAAAFYVSRPDAGVGYGGDVALVRVWECPSGGNCFTGDASFTTSAAAVAKERLHRLAGTYAPVGGVPVTYTRASTAHTDADLDGDGVRRLALVGSGWPRAAKRKEVSGGEYVTGALIEASVQNKALQGSEFDAVSWSPTEVTVDDQATTAPDGNVTADAIIGSALNNGKGVSQIITPTVASWTFSTFAKAGTGTGNKALLLYVDAVTDGACFKLSDCTLIDVYNGSTPNSTTAESYGNGWCRFSMSWTGSVVGTTVVIDASDDADSCGASDYEYTGDGATADLYLWGSQAEAGTIPTSYIDTTTAAVTRAGDDLRYTVTQTAPYTIECASLIPSDPAASGARMLLAGRTAATEYVIVYGDQSVGSGRAAVQNDPASGAFDAYLTAASGDMSDGERHRARAVAAASNNLRLYFDGTQSGTPDTATTPAAIARADIGYWPDFASYWANGLIERCRIWPGEVLP